MRNRSRFVFLSAVLIFIISCQGLGHNQRFTLQYKKDLQKFYSQNIQITQSDIRRKARTIRDLEIDMQVSRVPDTLDQINSENIKLAMQAIRKKDQIEDMRIETSQLLAEVKLKDNEQKYYTRNIYRTNLPFLTTDQYDTRGMTPIREGDPFKIAINRVHIAHYGEQFLSSLDHSEIAVVVRVVNGSEDPQPVLVGFEKGVELNSDFPAQDLLAFYTNAYNREPTRVEVILLELDEEENETYSNILGLAAQAGSSANPSFSPAIALATKVGQELIKRNENDILAKFTFQLYPWEVGKKGNTSANFGIPRIGVGSHMIIKNSSDEPIPEMANLEVGWDYQIYEVEEGHDKLIDGNQDKGLWPVPRTKQVPHKKLERTFLALKVSRVKLNSADDIINAVSALNHEAAGIKTGGLLTTAKAEALSETVNVIQSTVTRVAGEARFNKIKQSANALNILFNTYGEVNEREDQDLLLMKISGLLPEIDLNYKEFKKKLDENEQLNEEEKKDTLGLSVLKEWYDHVKYDMKYDNDKGKYVLKEVKNAGREQVERPRAEEGASSPQKEGESSGT